MLERNRGRSEARRAKAQLQEQKAREQWKRLKALIRAAEAAEIANRQAYVQGCQDLKRDQKAAAWRAAISNDGV